MNSRKDRIFLIVFATLYFCGAGFLVQQKFASKPNSIDASIVRYVSGDNKSLKEIIYNEKTLMNMIEKRDKLQKKADKLTENNQTEEAKELYRKMISLDEKIKKAIETLEGEKDESVSK